MTLDLPAAVGAEYGSCKTDQGSAEIQGFDPDHAGTVRRSDCTILLQMSSPSITAPEGLDVTRLGETYLQVLGMGAEEAASFAQTIDWTTTLVVPVPVYGTNYSEVEIDGTTGALIQQPGDFEYMLLWVKEGTVYVLIGPGNAQTALEIGNSLK